MSESAHSAKPATSEAKHLRWEDVPLESLNPLLARQLIVGEQIMVARVLLKKDCVVPMHSHANEQITHVETGALHFNVGGREVTVRFGEYLCIPPNVPHPATALEDTVDI